MTKNSEGGSAGFNGARSDLRARMERRWRELAGRHLPIATESIWMMSRLRHDDEPRMGWKLHVSATIFDASEILAAIGPYLESRGVLFKAPKSLRMLSKINSGIHFGYSQVGKFITVYPKDAAEAVELATWLDARTRSFDPVVVPFDRRFSKGSSVFFRYGAHTHLETAVQDQDEARAANGPEPHDDRTVAVPDGVECPFGPPIADDPAAELPSRYRVYAALNQRGKGGTFAAIDLDGGNATECVIKQGIGNGEVQWDGWAGADLVESEFAALKSLKGNALCVPEPLDFFQIGADRYLVLERINGVGLGTLLRRRKRRLPVAAVVDLVKKVSKAIGEVHQAGWIWNDCKPANIIIVGDGNVRLIDFENAYRIGERPRYDWASRGFSDRVGGSWDTSRDLYSVGALAYFLITGRFYAGHGSPGIRKLRQGVPLELVELVERLVGEQDGSLSSADEIAEILGGSRISRARSNAGCS